MDRWFFYLQGKEVKEMKNNVLQEQALGTDQLLRLTALLYFKEALAAQQYESCQELIDTARNLGVNSGDISAVITDHLNANGPGRQKANRLRSY
jgi:hypothetical protein